MTTSWYDMSYIQPFGESYSYLRHVCSEYWLLGEHLQLNIVVIGHPRFQISTFNKQKNRCQAIRHENVFFTLLVLWNMQWATFNTPGFWNTATKIVPAIPPLHIKNGAVMKGRHIPFFILFNDIHNSLRLILSFPANVVTNLLRWTDGIFAISLGLHSAPVSPFSPSALQTEQMKSATSLHSLLLCFSILFRMLSLAIAWLRSRFSTELGSLIVFHEAKQNVQRTTVLLSFVNGNGRSVMFAVCTYLFNRSPITLKLKRFSLHGAEQLAEYVAFAHSVLPFRLSRVFLTPRFHRTRFCLAISFLQTMLLRELGCNSQLGDALFAFT